MKKQIMTKEQRDERFAELMGPLAEAAKRLRGRVRVSLDSERLFVEVERAFAVSASMSASLNGIGRLEREGEESVFVVTLEPRVDVSWSSTQRGVAAATAAIALYRELTELAAEAEVLLNEQTWRVAY